MTRVQWEWRFLDADDAGLDRPLSPTFPSRYDAEAWLGETWRRLAEQGVASVVLLQGATPAAPPLPLRSP